MPIFLFAENKLIKCAYTKGLEKPRKLIVDHESTTKGLGYRVKQISTAIMIRNDITIAVLVFYREALIDKAFSCFYGRDMCQSVKNIDFWRKM